ncbi:hypothetical protein DIPPA_08408 [Diplonema papillatum]|nr:hypothetical protein DIPPA_08408 [Diplonema papillatum]
MRPALLAALLCSVAPARAGELNDRVAVEYVCGLPLGAVNAAEIESAVRASLRAPGAVEVAVHRLRRPRGSSRDTAVTLLFSLAPGFSPSSGEGPVIEAATHFVREASNASSNTSILLHSTGELPSPVDIGCLEDADPCRADRPNAEGEDACSDLIKTPLVVTLLSSLVLAAVALLWLGLLFVALKTTSSRQDQAAGDRGKSAPPTPDLPPRLQQQPQHRSNAVCASDTETCACANPGGSSSSRSQGLTSSQSSSGNRHNHSPRGTTRSRSTPDTAYSLTCPMHPAPPPSEAGRSLSPGGAASAVGGERGLRVISESPLPTAQASVAASSGAAGLPSQWPSVRGEPPPPPSGSGEAGPWRQAASAPPPRGWPLEQQHRQEQPQLLPRESQQPQPAEAHHQQQLQLQQQPEHLQLERSQPEARPEMQQGEQPQQQQPPPLRRVQEIPPQQEQPEQQQQHHRPHPQEQEQQQQQQLRQQQQQQQQGERQLQLNRAPASELDGEPTTARPSGRPRRASEAGSAAGRGASKQSLADSQPPPPPPPPPPRAATTRPGSPPNPPGGARRQPPPAAAEHSPVVSRSDSRASCRHTEPQLKRPASARPETRSGGGSTQPSQNPSHKLSRAAASAAGASESGPVDRPASPPHRAAAPPPPPQQPRGGEHPAKERQDRLFSASFCLEDTPPRLGSRADFASMMPGSDGFADPCWALRDQDVGDWTSRGEDDDRRATGQDLALPLPSGCNSRDFSFIPERMGSSVYSGTAHAPSFDRRTSRRTDEAHFIDEARPAPVSGYGPDASVDAFDCDEGGNPLGPGLGYPLALAPPPPAQVVSASSLSVSPGVGHQRHGKPRGKNRRDGYPHDERPAQGQAEYGYTMRYDM